MSASRRQVCDVLRRAARLQISIVIREPNHLVGIADINPLRVRSRWIEGDPVRPSQAASKNRCLFRLSVGSDSTKYANASRFTFCQEDVAVRSGAQQSRIIEPRGE